ncbi:carboxypeptidase-like regulatory domain-containing protein [Actinoplanes oblitus]|uniref:Carboxypeptidase-like regulatory domain-containing protein n=1 Tax=Actinoplanes oblitus TaxID=3040509 RepID=A0ABY8WFN4_9ACTN|nr:carboxypeptidase-like regulatory domain-containing protein [Actinoplanes oblitus]WIM96669.1 carboxypeptidase-like regulatory domain-containing protein [Actinoplanes oblitus]
MTTHLRGRAIQAGAFLALVVGLVAGVQTAALADSPTVQMPESLSGASGTTVTVSYTVGNPGSQGDGGGTGGEQGGGDPNVGIVAELAGGACNSGCGSQTATIPVGQKQSFNAQIALPQVGQGQTQDLFFQVTATVAGSPPTTRKVKITAKGPEAPKTVRQVSGKVRAVDGTRLAGASVAMTDSQGHTYQATTDGDGQFAFTSSDAQPISPGSITVGAVLDGYKGGKTTVNGRANRSVSATVTLKPAAAASASASASPSVSASATPADEATEDDEPTTDAATAANTVAADTTNASEDGGISWMLLVVGGLLVAAGIGAMVLVMLRRKSAQNNNDDDADGFGGGPIGSPAGPGRYAADATRVAAPVGARGNDATMVAGPGMGAAMGAGGIGDAPTMIHRAPVEDEFPDPYGAPMPPAGGFVGGGGAAGSQWDNQGGYGGGEYADGGQYGAQAGGYDNGQQRYDEHTSMYQPEQPQQPQRYDEHTNLYQPNNDGYGGGYDDQAGWGNQADNGGTYGGAGGYGAGYDQGHGGYDQAGYDQAQGGYGQPDQAGYGQQPGYDQHGGNYGNQAQPGPYGQDPHRRGNRDWEE